MKALINNIFGLLGLKKKPNKPLEVENTIIYLDREYLEEYVDGRLKKVERGLMFLINKDKISEDLKTSIMNSLKESSEIAINDLVDTSIEKKVLARLLFPVIPKEMINAELQMEMLMEILTERNKSTFTIKKTSYFAKQFRESFDVYNKDYYKGDDPEESDAFYVKHYGKTVISKYCKNPEMICNKIVTPKKPFWIYHVKIKGSEKFNDTNFKKMTYKEMSIEIANSNQMLFTAECGVSFFMQVKNTHFHYQFLQALLLFNSYYEKEENVVICELSESLSEHTISLFTFKVELEHIGFIEEFFLIPSFQKIYSAD